ncbi:RsmD family RNA methyltransferase [Nocardioides sp. CER19]|uniref:methyltransferase n=1 Tax=Nocardioides sp. CER19 TaxID=3038538 RepID=UPI0024489161|nr:RsmD family RNA methyltransferase [Nocardioides sp. CER19]MDH2416479.1 methyltransferase [Nocardioides sp. CER19]
MPETMTFAGLRIAYDERVLAPRTWTALQAEWAADVLDEAPDGPVLELCSGAGQIGLLAISRRPRRLVCVDDSAVACSYARRNAEAAGLGDLVEVRERDLAHAAAPDERFALVLADPPWVPTADTDRHPADPPEAIDGGPDGLDVARACLRVAAPLLLPGASVLLQLGTREQADTLAAQLTDLVLTEVRQGEGGVVVLLGAG